MVRACLPCLLLLFMVASTISLYQGGYYPTAVRYPAPTALSYDGFYGRTSYPTNTYRPTTYSRTSYPATSYPTSSYVPAYSALIKNSYSTGSNIPLCKAGGEMLLKVFVEKDYKPVLNAKVSYVDNKGLKTVSTNQYGLASLTVYGCSVALMVYHKEDNPVYRTVDLLSCTTRTEKVVINVDDKCNFNLVFSYTNIDDDLCGGGDSRIQCGDEHQMISLILNSTYDHTLHEEVVAKTACITAGQVGDNLKVVFESQVGNVFNVLDITLTDARTAVVALPPQLPSNFEYDMVLTSNTHKDTEEEKLNHLEDFTLYAKMGNDIVDSQADVIFDYFSVAVEKGLMVDDQWLLAVSFDTDGDTVDLEGNVVVNDCDGNYQSVQHPNSNSADYDEDDDIFLVGCFCNNVPSMKAGDFFAIGKYVLPTGSGTGSITSNPYDTHCAPICDANPPSTG